MKTYTYSREDYQTRFKAAQAEVANFQAIGMLDEEAQALLAKLPPVTQIADARVRTCAAIGDTYNHTLIAIISAVGRHAKNKQEVDGFCGLWCRNGNHDPYQSNIRKLLVGPIWKRIVSNGGTKLNDLSHTIHWFWWKVRELGGSNE
jgi:hypothetical protein